MTTGNAACRTLAPRDSGFRALPLPGLSIAGGVHLSVANPQQGRLAYKAVRGQRADSVTPAERQAADVGTRNSQDSSGADECNSPRPQDSGAATWHAGKFQLVLAATGNGTASCRRRTAASNVHSPASGPPQIEPAVVGSSRPEVSRRRALPREEPTSAGRGDRAR